MNIQMRSTIEQSIRQVRRTEGVIEAEALFPLSAPIFAGHFPARPLVPAVYQIALCRAAFETFHEAGFSPQVLRSRFSAACVPDALYNVKISTEENAGSLVANCAIHCGAVMYSKIVLLYEKRAIRD
jgi:3-hydroxymyristoyl/3-hydroxydecanoyl-(acyl carrier protein) dehydratase